MLMRSEPYETNPLRIARLREQLSQEELSVKLKVCWATVNSWERGQSHPTGYNLDRVEKRYPGVGAALATWSPEVKALGAAPENK